MNEAAFWSKIRTHLVGTGRLFARIENGLSAGTPDVCFVIDGVSGWVENKYRVKAPNGCSTKILGRAGLSKEQIVWATKYIRAGGRYFVLIGVGKAVFLLRPDQLQLKFINEATMSDLAVEAVFRCHGNEKLDGRRLAAALVAG